MNWRAELERLADTAGPDELPEFVGELYRLGTLLTLQAFANGPVPRDSSEPVSISGRALSAAEAAKVLGISKSSVYRMRDELGGFYMGPRILRFPEARVRAHLDSQ